MLVWQVKGAETVSYDENGIVIHLKKLIDRETTIPWNSIVEIEKYESPWWTFFRRSYLYNASLRIHYTSENGNPNTVRFGLQLNEKQQDIIMDRIYELRDKFSTNMDYNDSTINLFTLKNAHGLRATITNLGGRVVSLFVPDRNGILRDVVLGFENVEDYLPENHRSDFGAAIGRYANRLNNGQITIDGKTYQLPQNDGKNCLHGGPDGWQYRIFNVEEVGDNRLVLSLVSEDGDSGFPGNVCARVTYMLTDDNALDIQYEAVTDEPTVINMTNHSYFNLNGDPANEGMDMVMYVNADNYTPSDALYIPTGEVKPVEGTPMDFRQAHAIGETITDTTFTQIKNATGYDHNWCLNTYKDGKGDDSQVAVSLYSPKTGILLEVYTNEPGMQVYTGNFQGTGVSCKHGIKYPKHVSVCLESQKYPNSPNVKEWVSPYVKPGEKYYSHLVYKFKVEK